MEAFDPAFYRELPDPVWLPASAFAKASADKSAGRMCERANLLFATSRKPQHRRPPAACRCWAAAAVWSGPRAAQSRFVFLVSEAQRSGKTGAAIPRGESGLCDPRRSHTTTGASVRLTSVAHAHPYSPRERASARV